MTRSDVIDLLQWADLLDSMTVIQTVSYHILEGMSVDARI